MMKHIKKNWNNFSNTYGGSWIYFNSVSHHIELIREYKKYFSKYIKKDSVVLDLGAGRLFYKNFLKNYTDNYFSLDFKKTHKDLDYIGTTSHTNLENERFDLIHTFFGIPCGFIAMRLRLPYIVSLRGSDVPFYSKRFFLARYTFFQKTKQKNLEEFGRSDNKFKSIKRARITNFFTGTH